jgi:hypothetical protein
VPKLTRLWPLLLVLAMSSLAGCATKVSERVVYTCPPRDTFTPEESAKVADEIEAMPADAVTPRVVDSFIRLRDGCDALEK